MSDLQSIIYDEQMSRYRMVHKGKFTWFTEHEAASLVGRLQQLMGHQRLLRETATNLRVAERKRLALVESKPRDGDYC